MQGWKLALDIAMPILTKARDFATILKIMEKKIENLLCHFWHSNYRILIQTNLKYILHYTEGKSPQCNIATNRAQF